MIYIFDDRQERRTSNEPVIESYKNFVKFSIIEVDSLELLNDYILDTFADAKCIIFHSSYVFKSKDITFEKVKEIFKTLEVPFISFSGGIERATIRNNSEIEINADTMYSNLDAFLKECQSYIGSYIDILKILVWGKHNFHLNQLLNIQNRIATDLLLTVDFGNNVDDPDEIKRKIRRKIAEDFKDVSNSIETDIDKKLAEGTLTWGDIRDIIQLNIDTEIARI